MHHNHLDEILGVIVLQELDLMVDCNCNRLVFYQSTGISLSFGFRDES